MKISGSQNPQVEMQRLLTLFERLRANGMQIADPIQGMMLLNALPTKWDGVAMVYLQAQNVLANVTFASVRDAIMAEFERTSRPSSLAIQKISAVKRKGKSPTFKEQMRTNQSSAPKASSDAPQGAPDKKKRRGGKKAKVHAIVSSALIPESVAKCLQESHHVEAPAASPTPAIRTGIVVGGPSHAPANVPYTTASFNSSGIHYHKTEPPKSAQAYTGLPSKPGPHSLNKAMRKAELHLGTLPESKQTQFADIGVFNPSTAKAIEGACRLTGRLVAEEAEKLASSARRLVITDNAVASGSSVTLNDLPARPLVERLTTPPPSEVEPPLPPKKVCKRAHKNKGKKDSVHPTPIDPNMGNVRIFPEQARICQLYNNYELTAPKSDFSNPIAENGETLFREPVQNHENPYNLNEVNPRHPRAPFYQWLIASLEQERQGHIDLNGDNVGTYDPYLDDVSIGNDTDSEDEMKARPPIKRKVLNLGGVHWSEEETQSYKEGWDDRDNNPDSYAYDDYGQGYVNFSTNHLAHINDEQHVALASLLCSLISNVEQLNIMPHSVNCVKCVKKNKDQIDLLADSGASLHFTNQRSDLSELKL
jgi:hypothetical protein